MSRFASITADLLARKGEARPAPATPITPEMRKCTLRISQHDYERLGILAVKQGKTRQRVLQEAVGQLFTGVTEEYGPSCRCLGKPD
jgi:hypothetical protein